MTLVKYQIHCLVSKNDAVTIVIEDDCDRHDVSVQKCFRRGLPRSSRPNVIWIKIRSTAVRHHMSVVLQCHVVRCHSFNVCRTHHWCKPGWADMSKTSSIDHQLVLLSLVPRLIFPIHRVPTFSCCLPARISRVPLLRIQSCSLEVNLIAVQNVFGVQVSSTCLLLSLSLISVTLNFDFPEPLPLP